MSSFKHVRAVNKTRVVHWCATCDMVIPVGSSATVMTGKNEYTNYQICRLYLCETCSEAGKGSPPTAKGSSEGKQ